MKQEQISLRVINAHAAGIDVGSRTHFVAIGQEQKHVSHLVYMPKIWLLSLSGR